MNSTDDPVASPTPSPAPRRIFSTHPLGLLLVVVLGTLAIATALWATNYQVINHVSPEITLRAAGFRPRVANKLDPRFTDSTGELTADAPKAASEWVDPPTLVFCYVAIEDPQKFKDAWKPFTDYLSTQTGKPVEYLMATNANDQLKAMRDGKLHVAGFNTGSVPAAVNLCGFQPVCALPAADGTASTHSQIIVPSDSSLQKPEDLRGHYLTLTEPDSNSGYKAPLVLLRSQFGLQPSADVMLRFSGSHEASIAGIAHRRYEAAAVAADMLDRAISAGDIKREQYRTIFSSETFPTAGLGYVFNLKPELAKKIRDALLSFDWKGTVLESTLAETKGTKLVPVNYKNDWALIRRIDDEMGTQQHID